LSDASQIFIWRADCIILLFGRTAQLAEREAKVMKPTAKPVKRSKKLQGGKKLERKAPLVIRPLVVKWQ
jgi:hypothetical protein